MAIDIKGGRLRQRLVHADEVREARRKPGRGRRQVARRQAGRPVEWVVKSEPLNFRGVVLNQSFSCDLLVRRYGIRVK